MVWVFLLHVMKSHHPGFKSGQKLNSHINTKHLILLLRLNILLTYTLKTLDCISVIVPCISQFCAHLLHLANKVEYNCERSP